VENGFQVLANERAQENKERAAKEQRRARRKTFLALGLALPVFVLAMFGVELPWTIFNRNAGELVQAALAAIIVLALGWDFHRDAVRLAVRGAVNMDTLISIGTLTALAFSLWGLWVGGQHLYFETGAVITAFILLGRYLEAV